MEYKKLRRAGILLHVSSLPSNQGVGTFGKDAYDFIDCIKAAGFTFWQILPLCPIGYGASPYSSISAFAGNELFIDLDIMKNAKLLDKEDSMPFYHDRSKVNWLWVKEHKMPLLKKGALNFLKSLTEDKNLQSEFKSFEKKNSYWLSDYAMFRAIGESKNTFNWSEEWDNSLKLRDPLALKDFYKKNKEEVDTWKALQFIFANQWSLLRSYAKEKGIYLIGDLPFCSTKDSSEVWAHNELFFFDKNLKQTKSIGVPPDAFSKTGQLWGNPCYKWEKHKEENFKFWQERIKAQLFLYDYLRLDHFRGFESSWCVNAKEKTAENGKWEKTPGKELFETIFKEFKIKKDNNPFIAEDLGVITKEVDDLRMMFDLPSLRVMQFAFSHHNEDPHLPHMWNEDVIAYLGTHDNNTTVGWWNSLRDYEKDRVRRYLFTDDEGVPYFMQRSLLASRAPVVILSMQDLLFLDESARFNTPSTVNDDNWSWRMTSMFDIERYRYLLDTFARINK